MGDFDWLFFFEISLAGIGQGGLYAVTGIAFVIIYKATKVVNLAIGEILMLGAYIFLGLTSATLMPLWAAVLLTLAGGALAGMIIERVMIRPMMGRSAISVFMITIGLASILAGFVEMVWGSGPRRIPDFLPTEPIFIGNAYLSGKTGYSFLIAAIAIAVILLLFRFWRGGVALRATAEDQGAAYMMGINVPMVFSLSWIAACTAAAGTGLLVGSIGGLSPQMGVFGLSVLVVVIVGGLDSMLGTLIAGLLIGWIEAIAGTFLGGEFELLVTFSVLVFVLLLRPHGLFGTHEIERL